MRRQADTFIVVPAGMGRLPARPVMPELNHFQVPNQFNTADTLLSQAVPRMMLPRRTGQTGQ